MSHSPVWGLACIHM